jgi:hypothetical protein
MNAWICGFVMIANIAAASLDSVAELGIGDRIRADAKVATRIALQDKHKAVLCLVVERLPDAPIGPLSLEIRVAGSGGSEESVPLTTLSFFGVPPGQITPFIIPLPADVVSRASDGTLQLELRLSSSAVSELTKNARVRVRTAVVEPENDPNRVCPE